MPLFQLLSRHIDKIKQQEKEIIEAYCQNLYNCLNSQIRHNHGKSQMWRLCNKPLGLMEICKVIGGDNQQRAILSLHSAIVK